MKKSIFAVLLVIVAIVIIVVVAITKKPSSEQTSSDVIKIGVVSPLTGPKANLGEGLKQAITLAQKDYGPTKKTYQFIYEDSQGDAIKSANAVQKLITVDKVDQLVSISSQDGNITGKAAEDAKIPHFGIANDAHVEIGEYNFAHWAPVQAQAELLVKELQKRGYKKVAFLMEQNDAWVATEEAFKKAIQGTDITIVHEEKFTKDVTDFRTMLGTVKNSQPEIIVLESFSPMAENVANQKKQLGITIPLTAMTSIDTVQDLKPFEGDWYTSAHPATGTFAEEFQKQAGYPPTVGANYGYDIAKILFEVYDNATDISGPAIVKALNDFDYTKVKSSLGTLHGINADGRIFSDAALLQVKGGKKVLAE